MNLRIKFRSANLDQFIERYGVDVSRGGIFIRTREPLAVGTQLRFDFQLQDAAPLLAGEGTVVWIRENDPSRAGVTPGMGVRFDKLTPASQPVLEKILAEKGKRDQSTAAKPAAPGGLAVRRPSSTFSALDPAAARANAARTTGAAPRAPAPATGSGPLKTGAAPRAAAPATGSGPLSTSTRTTGARSTEPSVPPRESSGAFGRPRTTTGTNPARPAPAPQALFEKPTADDIDRALSVLTEVDENAEASTAPAPPVDFSAPRTYKPTDVHPVVLDAKEDVGAKAREAKPDDAKPPGTKPDDSPPRRVPKPTDVHPLVLESLPDRGDAANRRSGTQPLFSELRSDTVAMAPLGDAAAPGDDEEDATTAWIGSGPTRTNDDGPARIAALEAQAKAPASAAPVIPVGGEPTAPNAAPPPLVAPPPAASLGADKAPHLAATRRAMTPAAMAAVEIASLPKTAESPAAAPPGAAKSAATAPKLMTTSFAAQPPAKKRSAAPAIVVVLLLVAGGAAAFVLKDKLGVGKPATPVATSEPAAAPAPTPAPPAEAVAPAPTGEAKPAEAKPSEAPTEPAKADDKTAAAAKPDDKAAEAKPEPAAGDTATPSTLRAHPLGPPPEPPKEAEAAPEKEKEHAHRGHRRSAAAEESKSDAKPGEAEAKPEPAAESAPSKSGGGVPPPDVVKITTTPGGAEVIVDGISVGTTPYSANDIDASTPHSITLKKDGFESHDRMISGSDWGKGKGGGRALKITVKLHRVAGAEPAKAEGGEPAKAAEPPPAEVAPGLGTTPTQPKRE